MGKDNRSRLNYAERLKAIQDAQVTQVEAMLDAIEGQLTELKEDLSVGDAFDQFNEEIENAESSPPSAGGPDDSNGSGGGPSPSGGQQEGNPTDRPRPGGSRRRRAG